MASPSSMSTTDKSIFFATLGCAKNEVDTDRMRALLLKAGYSEAESLDDADLAIINTCSFLQSATQESIEYALSVADYAASSERDLPIVMCGCVPSRYGDEIADEMPELAAFVRHDAEDDIVARVGELFSAAEAGRGEEALEGALRTVEGASAFIKISEGCDRFCSFCAIPNIRGAYYSREAEVILAEIEALAEQGVREFVLIGQDTGIWGYDLEEPHDLAWLLEQAARVARPYGAWIRVLYLQPEGMTERLIEVIRDTPEVLPYIDIPIQHCNAQILSAMGRDGSADELRALFAHLREQIPGMVLRSTAMAGFPGETDEQAEELLSFIQEIGFDYCSVFAYSAEEGTRAAAMENQVDEAVKLERTQALADAAERMGFAATASHVGERVQVVIDGIEEGDDGYEFIGHSWFQAPDSDGVIHIAEGALAIGDIVEAELVDSFCYELVGVLAADEDERSWS